MSQNGHGKHVNGQGCSATSDPPTSDPPTSDPPTTDAVSNTPSSDPPSSEHVSDPLTVEHVLLPESQENFPPLCNDSTIFDDSPIYKVQTY